MPSIRFAFANIAVVAFLARRLVFAGAAYLAAGLVAAALMALGALAQNTVLPHAASNGFQPLLVPVPNEPLVLPQPIRIPTAIMPRGSAAAPLPAPQNTPPKSYSVSYPAPLPQQGLPQQIPQQVASQGQRLQPTPLQPAPDQQRAMFWERQGPVLPQQPTYVAPSYPASNYPVSSYPAANYPGPSSVVPAYPQVYYPPQPASYPQVIYPQVVYPQARSGDLVYPLHPLPTSVPASAPTSGPASGPSPAPANPVVSGPDTLQPLPEFKSGKGALQGYKQAAQIARARLGGDVDIVAKIDLSEQRMTVSVNGKPWYDWPVSTGRKGYRTPTGTWKVQRMHREYQSRKYDNAPMPYSLFYHGPYAIHGTNSVSRLGRTASHGCVRLHPKKAAMLFTLAEVFGKRAVTVKVQR